MEKKIHKYPEIGQFRNVIEEVKYRTCFVSKDDNGKPIFDYSKNLPIIKYSGTIKTHGTNSGIVFTYNEITKSYDVHFQSRERIITPMDDNAGFAVFASTNPVHELLDTLPELSKYSDNEFPTIKIYGEWIGKGIQAGVAVSQLDKRLIVFGVKIDNAWISDIDLAKVKLLKCNIFNIFDFPNYEIEVDFNNPKIAADQIAIWVDEVENECPVGKAFGIEGIGEGIVFKPIDDNWREGRFYFKAKGEKHSKAGKDKNNKVKVEIDVVKVDNINNLINTIVTDGRLEQGISWLKENGHELSNKSIGTYIKWVYGDTIKEELDTIVKNGFEPKDVNSYISNKARNYFINYLNNEAGI